MKKTFAVSMLFRQHTPDKIKERLITKIVGAENDNEAFGFVYNNTYMDFQDYDMAFKTCIEVALRPDTILNFNWQEDGKDYMLEFYTKDDIPQKIAVDLGNVKTITLRSKDDIFENFKMEE